MPDISNIQKKKMIKRIVRAIILFGVLVVAIGSSGTEDQWIKLEGNNTLARIWLCASMFITFIFSIWINDSLIDSDRYNKPFLKKHKVWLSRLHVAIVTYTMIIAITIFFADKSPFLGWFEDTRGFSFFGGPALVVLLYIFDRVILSMEKTLAERDTEKTEEDIKEYQKARAVAYHLDVPILLGVTMTWIVCMLLTTTEQLHQNYLAGFVSGATGMQIIIANVAFDIINS